MVDPNLLEDEGLPRSRRRPALIAAVAILCALALAGGLFALLRSDGDGGGEEATTEVTFTPDQAATSLAAPPPNRDPVMAVVPDNGPAGVEVTLQGAGFKGDDHRPVELRWDKADGQRLMTVDGPRFSVKLQIPKDAAASAQPHNVVALQRTDDGKLVSQVSVPFFVLPPRP